MATEYAYGENELNGCECPALQAGVDPKAETIRPVVEWYDRLTEKQTGVQKGTLPKKVAQQNWHDAMEKVEEKEPLDHVAEEVTKTAEAVANDAF